MALDLDALQDLLVRALQEDVGPGDITSEAVIPPDARARAAFVMRRDAVVAGLPVVERLFALVSPAVRFEPLVSDGERVEEGQVVARVEGPARTLLRAERLALNFLQRLSGIATLTRRCVVAAGETGVQIMDTRKTTPCWRILEKYAVRCGGGANHRMGLYDQVLIKDNHLRVAARRHGDGAVAWSVRTARQAVGPGIKVEAEADTLQQAAEAVEAGADVVMLDNMDLEAIRRAVADIRAMGEAGRRVEIEVSGGVGPDEIADLAATGVNRISLGCLTHSAPAADIALQFE